MTCFLVFFNSCNKDKQEKKSEIIYTSAEDLIRERIDLMKDLTLDSIKISNDTLITYVSDTLIDFYNDVLVTQKFAVIYQDFCMFNTDQFEFISFKYNIPKRDSVGPFEFYQGSLETLKQELVLFNYETFRNIVNEVFEIHYMNPKDELISKFNHSLSITLFEDGVGEFQFFGTSFINISSSYLIECENRENGYITGVVNKSINRLLDKGFGVNQDVVNSLKNIFERNCQLSQELNPINDK